MVISVKRRTSNLNVTGSRRLAATTRKQYELLIHC